MVTSKPTNGAGQMATMRYHLDRLCLLGHLPHEVRQGKDFMHSAYAILKIPPEGYAQLPASLLQADKGVAASPAQFAPRAGADLPLLRPFPNVALREIVVQRNLRPLQNQQEIVPLFVNPPQRFVQIRKAGSPPKQPVKIPLQGCLPPQRRRFAVGPQTLVILPHGIADAIDRLLFPTVHAADQNRPNIVIIWGDDIGQSNISAYSHGVMGYKTPNIDRVAKEGMMFTDYYAEQSCTAGRASFITGQSGLRTGLTKVGLPGAALGLQKEDPTIAELLKPLGYATGQFGKNHLGDRNEFLPTVHGFDEFYGNLYHLNAEEEPELAGLPERPGVPRKVRPARRAGQQGQRHG